jgi:hypothetical protein
VVAVFLTQSLTTELKISDRINFIEIYHKEKIDKLMSQINLYLFDIQFKYNDQNLIQQKKFIRFREIQKTVFIFF